MFKYIPHGGRPPNFSDVITFVLKEATTPNLPSFAEIQWGFWS